MAQLLIQSVVTVNKSHAWGTRLYCLGEIFTFSLQTKDVHLVNTLPAFGANMSHLGLNGFTPLDHAIQNCNTECPEVEHVCCWTSVC